MIAQVKTILCLLGLIIVTSLFYPKNALAQSKSGGGMYPISLLKQANLQEKGLNLSNKDIFNPKDVGLINSIVRIGGCTGSFVSEDGLILTNHHCVFSHLKKHSNAGNNYMETGFHANGPKDELPLKGLEVKIMKDYKDVSNEVVKGISDTLSPTQKQRSLNQNQQKVREKYQDQFPDLKIEVSEMLTGESYVLFKYQMLKDLRIVYAPPRTVGEFGGASDNWEWPRHTGDFSFVRAYVDENGEPAEYDESNVPFQPEKHLSVDPDGVKAGDFVFIPGYPGRTFRHRPASFIKFHQEVQLPYIADLFEWKIAQLEHLTQQSDTLKIKYDPRIKTLSNVAKNYRGKLKTLKSIDLLKAREKEEDKVQAALKKQGDAGAEFEAVLKGIDSTYADIIDHGYKIFWYSRLTSTSDAVTMARQAINIGRRAKNSPDSVKIDTHKMIDVLRNQHNKIDPVMDSMFVRKMLMDARDFEGANRIHPLSDFLEKDYEEGVNAFIEAVYKERQLLDTSFLFEKVKKNPASLASMDDPMIKLWKALESDYAKTDSIRSHNFSKLAELQPKYVNLKMKAKEGLFIPDANSTLRITHGKIKGYSPRDAVHYEPFTSINGYVQKAEPEGDFRPNPEMVKIIRELNDSVFENPETNAIPICMLYNTDTSGGNSGSPVLDADGKLVGLNFDRTYRGTITDYEWSNEYSRSIGVDIRFMLWYLQSVSDADHLLEEMNVKAN